MSDRGVIKASTAILVLLLTVVILTIVFFVVKNRNEEPVVKATEGKSTGWIKTPDPNATMPVLPTNTLAYEIPTPTVTPSPTLKPTSKPTQKATASPVPVPTVDESEYKRQKYYIEVSLNAQIVYVYNVDENGDKGSLVKTMICSTGREGHETPKNRWVILSNELKQYSSYEWEWLSKGCGHFISRLWKITEEDGAEEYSWSSYLFHSVPYEMKDKNTLHWEEWNKIGTPASDGCIRLYVSDAWWIYTYCAPYTYVYTVDGEKDETLWNKLKLPDIDKNTKSDPTDIYP